MRPSLAPIPALLATLLLFASGLGAACGEAPSPPEDDTTTADQPISPEPTMDDADAPPDAEPTPPEGRDPILAQGTLPWFEEVLFLLEHEQRLSWLFELDEADAVTFTLSGFGAKAQLATQIKRWNVELAQWEEVSWLQARSDAEQALVIERQLEPGFYWLVVGGELGSEEPAPFKLLASCASQRCVQTSFSFAPASRATEETPDEGLMTRDGDAIGLSGDFRAWLEREHPEHDFSRASLEGGSYGGRLDAKEAITRDPVIFIHGNSDRALGGPLGGWQRSLTAFREAGYTPGELYAITWGDADPKLASMQYHSQDHLLRIRRFIEAVLAYTGAEKIDIVTHSMGVTLARRAILGGTAHDLLAGGAYELGPPLTGSIDAFVGIAGANRGLLACGLTGPSLPTCSATNGLYPGMYWGRAGRSDLLKELDAQAHFEGAFVATIWSPADEVVNAVGKGSMVWGEVTSRIEGQDVELVLDEATHLESRDLSTEAQLSLVIDHRLP